jgi:hypothetical protein
MLFAHLEFLRAAIAQNLRRWQNRGIRRTTNRSCRPPEHNVAIQKNETTNASGLKAEVYRPHHPKPRYHAEYQLIGAGFCYEIGQIGPLELLQLLYPPTLQPLCRFS